MEEGLGTKPGGSAVLRALGSIAISVDDERTAIGGEKPRRLLAALILHRNHVVSTSQLIDIVWGDESPDTSIATLQAYVSRLRRALPTVANLVTEAPGYRLEVAEGATDIDRFEDGLIASRALADSAPAAALARLDAALAEWRGEAFAEFADEPWVMSEVVRLDELRLQAREERLRYCSRSASTRGVAGEAEALTVEHPWREEPWRALLLGLHRAGRQGDALRAANGYRTRLREDLGLDPSAEFVELERQIATATVPPRPQPSPRPRSTTPSTGDPTDLVGRDDDLALVEGLIAQYRLVTLLGPGGIGKTQLARSVARRLTSEVGGATSVVELAPVRSETGVVRRWPHNSACRHNRVARCRNPCSRLLASASLLLVLDNCEHVLETIAGFVQRLLIECPSVVVLATSREPLGLPNETVYQVPTLPAAGPEANVDAIIASPAVELFLRRATAANRALQDDERTVRSVAELCRRLDGVPLAIELAAARTRASPDEINARLGDRFELLAGSSRVADERHRSLSAPSWTGRINCSTPPNSGCSDGCRRSPGRSTSMPPSACVDTASCRPVRWRNLLASLVDKSMVQASPSSGTTTYRLLETLREFGAVFAETEDREVPRRHGGMDRGRVRTRRCRSARRRRARLAADVRAVVRRPAPGRSQRPRQRRRRHRTAYRRVGT